MFFTKSACAGPSSRVRAYIIYGRKNAGILHSRGYFFVKIFFFSAEIGKRFLLYRVKNYARFCLNDALRRLNFADKTFKIAHCRGVDFQYEHTAARDGMALDDLRVRFNEFFNGRKRVKVIFVARSDLDKRAHVKADHARIENKAVLLDNARRFKLFYPVYHRRDRHPDLFAYFRRAET